VISLQTSPLFWAARSDAFVQGEAAPQRPNRAVGHAADVRLVAETKHRRSLHPPARRRPLN